MYFEKIVIKKAGGSQAIAANNVTTSIDDALIPSSSSIKSKSNPKGN